ncbi:MAG: hypothetical protein S4CHLAM7_07210 [Chlamydiae bacterium]|nr:hypothetical protein [Chlamydiota bacterium]
MFNSRRKRSKTLTAIAYLLLPPFFLYRPLEKVCEYFQPQLYDLLILLTYILMPIFNVIWLLIDIIVSLGELEFTELELSSTGPHFKWKRRKKQDSP